MTKEERLKQEAEEYQIKLRKSFTPLEQICWGNIYKAYIAGAEPREKRIEELELENAELKERLELLNLNANIAVRDLNDQLIKAKELIEDMYDKIPASHSDYYKDVMDRARQFLKEIDK